MVDIHIVRKENRHLYEHLFDAYYRTRHDIYVKQRKWLALDRPDGREIDQFDTPETVYLMAIADGKIVGSMRAVPTLQPTLLCDLFPYLNLRAPIRQSDVYELSRIFVLPEWRGERAGVRLEAALRAAIVEYGLSIGLSGFTIVLEAWWLPRFEVDGWKARPLGLPVDVDGMTTLAVFVTCDEETWFDICERRNIPGEILVWKGLGGVSRRPLLSHRTIAPR